MAIWFQCIFIFSNQQISLLVFFLLLDFSPYVLILDLLFSLMFSFRRFELILPLLFLGQYLLECWYKKRVISYLCLCWHFFPIKHVFIYSKVQYFVGLDSFSSVNIFPKYLNSLTYFVSIPLSLILHTKRVCYAVDLLFSSISRLNHLQTPNSLLLLVPN